VTMGATTIWERWDSMRPDGSINPGEMTSFNHYALGAIADWMHRVIGGLAPAAPGYRQITVAPHPGGGLTRARARHITPYGPAECAWQIQDGQISVDVIVPPNSSALVSLPGSDQPPVTVQPGSHHWAYPYQPPADAHAARSLDSMVGELLNDSAAWEAIKAVVARHNMDVSSIDIGTVSSQTLRQLLTLRPDSEMITKELEETLASLG
jgi:alpha-L-rhamnosidase